MSTTRVDLPYLRRRVRPPAGPSPTTDRQGGRETVSNPAVTFFLTQGRGSAPSAPATTTVPAASPAHDLDSLLTISPASGAGRKRVGGVKVSARTPLVPALTGFGSVGEGERRLMAGNDAVVALTRVQSGIGVLEVSLSVPDLDNHKIALAYECCAKKQYVLGYDRERNQGDHPFTLSRSGRLLVDLRRVRSLRRFLVSVSACSSSVRWTGAAVVSTLGGARLEVPLGHPGPHENLALLTGYNVDGQLVVRAEDDPQDVPLKRLCEDYGYTKVGWRDDRHPL